MTKMKMHQTESELRQGVNEKKLTLESKKQLQKQSAKK